jgi:hypothetical protein
MGNKETHTFLTKQTHKKLMRFNAIYGKESFLGSFSLLRKIRKHRLFRRWLTLTVNMEKMQDDVNMIKTFGNKSHNYYGMFDDGLSEQVTKEFINKAFPDYCELTYKYILSGYDLEWEWEREIVNYLKNDKVMKLSDELVFILFSTKIPVNDFLELSELPKSYLAKLLPMKADHDG